MRKLIDGMGSANGAAPAEAANGHAQQATVADSARSGVPLRILIVDDNAAFRASLDGVLHDMGHLSKAAANGREAMQIARDWSPQVVFLDVNMPDINGYELARRFRSEFPASGIKLVMLSGDTLNEAAARGAKSAGFDLCMDKLSSFAEIKRMLDVHRGSAV
jgi:CheY-like chemotaxis protein